MIRIALAVALSIAAANPAAAAYCAMYWNGTRACGIPSLEACRQSVSGIGGNCQEDFTDQIPPNFVQRLRSERAPPLPRGPLPPGASGPFRPLDTSPCMSLSGDTCKPNYLH